MNILQTKITNIAMAPEMLSDAINKYSVHSSKVVDPRTLVRSSHYFDDIDILLCHNVQFYIPNKKTFIMYHSEPGMVQLNPMVNEKLVIAQYHATLPEFNDCKIVRNVIDFKNTQYDLYYPEKIRIGFSPSRTFKIGNWHDKGYIETKNVLNEIKGLYADKVEIDIITGIPLKECLERKRKCDIIIDEVITGSYHRSGLEGLGMGKLTICKLSDQVKDVLKNASGSDEIPFYESDISNLKDNLIKIIESGIDNINEVGIKNRKWMEKFWSPEIIVNEFIEIFNQ